MSADEDVNAYALGKRYRIAKGAIIAFIGASVLLAVSEVLLGLGAVTLDGAEDRGLAAGIGIANLFYALAYVGSVVAVAIWIYRAHSNLAAADVEGLEFTPGWAVGWFFIPIMNLFKPYQAMRSLWHNSHGTADQFSAPAPDVLRLWWGAWIIGNFLSNLSFRMEAVSVETALLIDLPATLLMLASAWLLFNIMQAITTAQTEGAAVRRVFA